MPSEQKEIFCCSFPFRNFYFCVTCERIVAQNRSIQGCMFIDHLAESLLYDQEWRWYSNREKRLQSIKSRLYSSNAFHANCALTLCSSFVCSLNRLIPIQVACIQSNQTAPRFKDCSSVVAMDSCEFDKVGNSIDIFS